ncbi:MAG: hypothetical protein ACRC20_05910 [Segniliparus sp.]|uniref:hypothetical protein n=1 Tax=Segniliparus sp. TaxID=2804064 RepID=UPI003F376AB5
MTKFFTRSAALLAGAAAGLPLVAAPAASAEPQVHRVVFRVFGPQLASLVFGPGPGSLALVSYKGASVDVDAKLVPLPWNIAFQSKAGDAELVRKLRLSVTRPESEQDVHGVYACEISVDGEVRARSESDLEDGGLQCVIDGSDDS